MKNAKKILAAVLMIAVMISVAGCDSSDYKKAAQLMADGDYAAASEAFKALGDYNDSAAQATECDYQIAKAAFDGGNYEQAVELLTALGDYQDSAELAKTAADKVLSGKIIGAWKSDEVDMTELFSAIIEASLNPDSADEILADVDFGTISMAFSLELTTTGSCYMQVDADTIEGCVDAALSAFKQGFMTWAGELYEQVAAENNMTMEQLMEAYECSTVEELFVVDNGMDIDEFMDTYFPKDQYIAAVSAVCTTGTFEVKDGSIEMTFAGETETVKYDAEADTIIMDGEELSGGDIVFKRAA